MIYLIFLIILVVALGGFEINITWGKDDKDKENKK